MPKWTVDSRSVAVVGMSCRTPGASSPDELWSLLTEGRDATGETPLERYDVDGLYGASATPGKVASRRAGYLDDIAGFDARFFGLSTAEAIDLDPQQRLVLMAAWEALEDAGQRPDRLAGSRTGVFVGNARSDYLENVLRQGPEAASAAQLLNVRSMVPARLSHFFDFRGPSISVDTACSSSLTAVHQAVQSLRSGECPFAIAAGVNLAIRPDEGIMMSQVGSMSADGRSKFGDRDTDGHAPSDTVAVIALKPLDRAVADGDRIRAVIAGSAVGNDGRTSDSVLNPSLDGQLEMLSWAYQDARIDPSDVDYVEAHGSGSPQLDPLELTALSQVLGSGRGPGRPLLVGSVKTNLGHAEAAGGLAGLIKTVLCLENGQVPASLHADNPRPDVPWDDVPMEIPAKLRDLPDLDRPIVAGVSGQGSSALNAHIVLRQAPAVEPATEDSGRRKWPFAGAAKRRVIEPPYLLPLSARTPEALHALAHAYVEYLGEHGPGAAHTLRDICYSAATRRQHLEHRLVVIGTSRRELIDALSSARARTGAGLTAVADRYLNGDEVDWDEVFGPDAGYVPLPTYQWQTERYWPGDSPDVDGAGRDDLTSRILDQHARTDFTDESLLADIGIDSLAKVQLIVELQQKTGREVDPKALDDLRTTGELRTWVRELETAAS